MKGRTACISGESEDVFLAITSKRCRRMMRCSALLDESDEALGLDGVSMRETAQSPSGPSLESVRPASILRSEYFFLVFAFAGTKENCSEVATPMSIFVYRQSLVGLPAGLLGYIQAYSAPREYLYMPCSMHFV